MTNADLSVPSAGRRSSKQHGFIAVGLVALVVVASCGGSAPERASLAEPPGTHQHLTTAATHEDSPVSATVLHQLVAEGYRSLGHDIMWEYVGRSSSAKTLDGPTLDAEAHAAAKANGWGTLDGALRDGFGYLSDVPDRMHVFNREYLDDGIVGDPRRPESLVYDLTSRQLLAVMLMVPVGEHGPRVLRATDARWHVHAVSMCFGPDRMLPTGYAVDGVSPCRFFGRWSAEMLHIWFQGPPFSSKMPGDS